MVRIKTPQKLSLLIFFVLFFLCSCSPLPQAHKNTPTPKEATKTEIAPSTLQIEIIPAKHIASSEPFKIWLRIVNPTSKLVKTAIVTCQLGTGFQHIFSTRKGDLRDGEMRWQLTDITPQEEMQIEVELYTENPNRYPIVAKIEGMTNEQTEVRAQTATTLVIESVKVASNPGSHDTRDPIFVGEQTTYVIEVRNESLENYTNLRLVNQIPEQMKFLHAIGPDEFESFEYDESTRTVSFVVIDEIWPQSKAVWQITCQALEAGAATNRAIVSCDQLGKLTDEEVTTVR